MTLERIPRTFIFRIPEKYFASMILFRNLIRCFQMVNHFMYVEKWTNILKNLAVFTPQEFLSMFNHFSRLCMK